MAELEKVRRVIARQLEGAPHETLLTIDATTGQNGLRQAKLFAQAADVDGVVLTKLDGTRAAGVALAIARELELPVKLIGIGETVEDLRPFDPDDFARALIAGVTPHARVAAPRGLTWAMDAWIIWLVAASVLGVGEMHRVASISRRSPSARPRGGLSLLGVGRCSSAIVFAAPRQDRLRDPAPGRRRHRRLPPSMRTGAAALVGQPAIVLERIANHEGVGSVKIRRRGVDGAQLRRRQVIDAGEQVEVVEIRGATALVMH